MAVGLVLTAVFVPCIFIAGIIGEFYRQFAVTIAVSTLLSAFNSLTLSPALCALLLKPKGAGEARSRCRELPSRWPGRHWRTGCSPHTCRALLPELAALPGWMTPVVAGVPRAARRLAVPRRAQPHAGLPLRRVPRRVRGVHEGVSGARRSDSANHASGAPRPTAGLLSLTYFAITTTPSGFIPPQDKGYLLVNIHLPDAASLERTEAQMRRLEQVALKTPGREAHRQRLGAIGASRGRTPRTSARST